MPLSQDTRALSSWTSFPPAGSRTVWRLSLGLFWVELAAANSVAYTPPAVVAFPSLVAGGLESEGPAIDADAACVYVDFAGNSDLRRAIHTRFVNLKHSSSIGGTHVEHLGAAKDLPGPRATLSTPMAALLPMLADEQVDAVPVLEGGRIDGIVTSTDLISALARHSLQVA